MSQPTPMPDAIDEANATFWRQQDVESTIAGSEPHCEEESFEITDLTDDEWAVFQQAIRE